MPFFKFKIVSILGDQVKKCTYLAQSIFVKNSTQLLQWKKGSQKMSAIPAIFKKPKVNNRPICENSPNLVTLFQLPMHTWVSASQQRDCNPR
jgi:hypothetical protein